MSKLFMYRIQSDISNLKIENVELILNCHDAHQGKFKIATINDTRKRKVILPPHDQQGSKAPRRGPPYILVIFAVHNNQKFALF